MRLNKSVTTRVTLALMLAGILLSGPSVTVRRQVAAGSDINTGATHLQSRAVSSLPLVVPHPGKIVFSEQGEIYIMNADGSQLTQLTNGDPNVEDCQPALSPDGTRIAFISSRNGNYNIYIMNVDGTNVHHLTNGSSPKSSPAWSPDGTRIAFVLGHDLTVGGDAYTSSCGSEIYVIEADGGQWVSLTAGAGGSDPAWSPDGTQIAFSSYRNGNYEIFVMRDDGSNVTQLTFTDSAEADPAWSPDGEFIAYGADYDPFNGENCGFIHTPDPPADPEKAAKSSIYVMTAGGKGQVQLTTVVGSDPVWSPSGTRIAFIHNQGEYAQIYCMNADGSNLIRVTDDQGSKSSPSWSQLGTLW